MLISYHNSGFVSQKAPLALFNRFVLEMGGVPRPPDLQPALIEQLLVSVAIATIR